MVEVGLTRSMIQMEKAEKGQIQQQHQKFLHFRIGLVLFQMLLSLYRKLGKHLREEEVWTRIHQIHLQETIEFLTPKSPGQSHSRPLTLLRMQMISFTETNATPKICHPCLHNNYG